MAASGPFGPRPRLALGVSGGADSTALALLAHAWVKPRAGSVAALIADHGLRPEAGEEARRTASVLAARGIECRIIRLDLQPGPAVQKRARIARYDALAAAAREAGAVHLLLGHHQGDQIETAMMRAARGGRGLAAMAAVTSRHDVAVLRPLLGIEPGILRAFLLERNCPWIEDPSNGDCRFERVALRRALADGKISIDPETIRRAATARRMEMRETAQSLARRAEIRPEGYVLLRGGETSTDALAALLCVVGGRIYPPPRAAVAKLAASLRPATIGGVQIAPAGRLVPGEKAWVLAREPAACAPAQPLAGNRVWDRRFHVLAAPDGVDRIGRLGGHAKKFRDKTDLPVLILKSLPVLYDHAGIVSVPHLRYGPWACLAFIPPVPAAPQPFVCQPSSHLFV